MSATATLPDGEVFILPPRTINVADMWQQCPRCYRKVLWVSLANGVSLPIDRSGEPHKHRP